MKLRDPTLVCLCLENQLKPLLPGPHLILSHLSTVLGFDLILVLITLNSSLGVGNALRHCPDRPQLRTEGMTPWLLGRWSAASSELSAFFRNYPG